MHFSVKPLDVLLAEAADAGRKLHRTDQPRLFPTAERVLVNAEPPSRFAHAEQGHFGIVLAIVEDVKFGVSGGSERPKRRPPAVYIRWGRERARAIVVDLVEKMYCI